jgi:hypothetical protein
MAPPFPLGFANLTYRIDLSQSRDFQPYYPVAVAGFSAATRALPIFWAE